MIDELKTRKQYVDIRTVGLLSNTGPGLEPGYYNKMREIRRNTHTVVDSRHTCNICRKKFYENKYGVYYVCENCFEQVHNEKEMKVFKELSPLFLLENDGHIQKPDNHLTGIQQIDDNIFVLDIEYDYDMLEKIILGNNYKILYKFEASDGVGNSLIEWVIKCLDIN